MAWGCPGVLQWWQGLMISCARRLPQDLADAEAALQQGFTGSLSRVPTSSSQREVALAEEAGSDVQNRPAGGAAGEAGGAEGPAAGLLQHGSADLPVAQHAAAAAAGEDAVAAELAAAAAQQEAELMDMVGGRARGGWVVMRLRSMQRGFGGLCRAHARALGWPVGAADLPACTARQRVGSALKSLLPHPQVLALELDLGGTGDAAEEHYSRTLHSATSSDSRAAQQPR